MLTLHLHMEACLTEEIHIVIEITPREFEFRAYLTDSEVVLP
jgi:hypothetical protein